MMSWFDQIWSKKASSAKYGLWKIQMTKWPIKLVKKQKNLVSAKRLCPKSAKSPLKPSIPENGSTHRWSRFHSSRARVKTIKLSKANIDAGYRPRFSNRLRGASRLAVSRRSLGPTDVRRIQNSAKSLANGVTQLLIGRTWINPG